MILSFFSFSFLLCIYYHLGIYYGDRDLTADNPPEHSKSGTRWRLSFGAVQGDGSSAHRAEAAPHYSPCFPRGQFWSHPQPPAQGAVFGYAAFHAMGQLMDYSVHDVGSHRHTFMFSYWDVRPHSGQCKSVDADETKPIKTRLRSCHIQAWTGCH